MTRSLMNHGPRLTMRSATKRDVLLGITLAHAFTAGACGTPSEQAPGPSTAPSAATTSSGTMGTTGRVEQAAGSGGAPEVGASPASTGIAGAPDADVPNADAPPENGCPAGLADCDETMATGCETRTDDDIRHCGACNAACGLEHADAACVAGACQLTCFQGFGNCNDDPSDGCETDLANSWEHCSGCSSACDLPNVETQRCDGRCVVTTCSPGYADCNDNPSDGCEAALESDPRHCGWCGHSCGSSSCDAGVCSAQAFDSGFRFSGERTQLVHYNDSYWAMLRVESEVGLWRNNLDGWDANWLSFASEDIFFTLAGDGDRMYWADSDGDIFRADAEHPDGWVIAERPDAITMLSVADDRMVWIEGANRIQLADADAQILDTVEAVATDVLAYPNGYYYATDTTVYRRTTVTTEMGDCLAESMLAYDPAGALVYWTGDSHSDPGTLRNDVSADDAVPLPSGGILGLIVYDSYTYWTTTEYPFARARPDARSQAW